MGVATGTGNSILPSSLTVQTYSHITGRGRGERLQVWDVMRTVSSTAGRVPPQINLLLYQPDVGTTSSKSPQSVLPRVLVLTCHVVIISDVIQVAGPVSGV